MVSLRVEKKYNVTLLLTLGMCDLDELKRMNPSDLVGYLTNELNLPLEDVRELESKLNTYLQVRQLGFKMENSGLSQPCACRIVSELVSSPDHTPCSHRESVVW